MNKILFVFFILNGIGLHAMNCQGKVIAKTQNYTIKKLRGGKIRLYCHNKKQIQKLGALSIPKGHDPKFALIDEAAKICAIASERAIFCFTLQTQIPLQNFLVCQEIDSEKITGISAFSSKPPSIQCNTSSDTQQNSFLIFTVSINLK